MILDGTPAIDEPCKSAQYDQKRQQSEAPALTLDIRNKAPECKANAEEKRRDEPDLAIPAAVTR